MKDKCVCNGCKYRVSRNSELNGTCDYSAMNGESRLAVERRNGGYKKDGCACYEAGVPKNKSAIPWAWKRE